jgi:hypothetical protein
VAGGALDHRSALRASIAAGGSRAYTAEGFDASNNSLGDVDLHELLDRPERILHWCQLHGDVCGRAR